MMKRFRLARVGAVVAGACLIGAACGSDSTSSSGATTAAPASTTAASTTGSVSGATTTAAGASTTAGGAASGIVFSTSNQYKASVDRTGQTIKIGLANNEGGAFSLPEFRIGAEAGRDYVNAHGGVNGAKIEFVECNSDASPEGAVNCANQFVEKKVDIASYGIEVVADAVLPIYDGAGIPFITPAAYGDKQRKDPNAWTFGSAAGAYVVWPLKAFESLGAKKIAFIAEDQPSAHNFVDLLNKWSRKLGITITGSTLVNPASPDYTAAVQTGMSQGADGIWAFVSESGCTAFATAVAQIGYKGVAMAGACSQYISVLGKQSVGTLNLIDTYYPDVAASAPSNIQQNLKVYADAMKAAGQDKYVNGFASITFAFMQDLKTLLETIPTGPINADSIRKALGENRGLPSWNGPDFNCGAKVWPAEPSYCRSGLLILKVVEQNGQFVRQPLSTENSGYFNDPKIAAESTSI